MVGSQQPREASFGTEFRQRGMLGATVFLVENIAAVLAETLICRL
jgi:hypothetical protein